MENYNIYICLYCNKYNLNIININYIQILGGSTLDLISNNINKKEYLCSECIKKNLCKIKNCNNPGVLLQQFINSKEYIQLYEYCDIHLNLTEFENENEQIIYNSDYDSESEEYNRQHINNNEDFLNKKKIKFNLDDINVYKPYIILYNDNDKLNKVNKLLKLLFYFFPEYESYNFKNIQNDISLLSKDLYEYKFYYLDNIIIPIDHKIKITTINNKIYDIIKYFYITSDNCFIRLYGIKNY